MYLEHFGLRDHPFASTPDTNRFFAGGGREELLQKLQAAIDAGDGFIQVTGTAGSGKTMLCRMLCQRLTDKTRAALLLNPTFAPEELIPALLNEFRFPAPTQTDRLAARQLLLRHLLGLNRKGAHALLLIDEAHCMSLAMLEELRLLGNLETGQAKLLQVVLFAQPQFAALLQDETARGFQERITTRLTLAPFGADETDRYLTMRLQAVGFQGERLFTRPATRGLHFLSSGRPLRIHRLAQQAMQQSASAASHQVTLGDVSRAALENVPGPLWARGWRPLLATAGVIALLLGGGWIQARITSPQANHAPDGFPPVAIPESRIAHPAVPATVPAPVAMRTEPLPMVEAAATPPVQQRATPTAIPELMVSTSPPAPSRNTTPIGTQPTPTTDAQPIQVPDEMLFLADASENRGNGGPEVELPGTPYVRANDPFAPAILASHRWLKQGDEKHYTIQLVLLHNEKGLEILASQLTSIQPPLGQLDLKVFRLKDDTLLVYLNECPTAVACEALMNRLPLALRANNPSVRSLARLKTTVRKLALATPSRTG
ncbi:MAG: AAA family ATPase [Magnetococcales bacterium]|nr:AAA family ATPase [Magnetococcales bacterium]